MIEFQLQVAWPKLAWVAILDRRSGRVSALHGPMVEVRDDWAAEGVWDGPFTEGNFDRTDLVFGTGLRRRGDQLVFVSSATGVDRLWHVEHRERIYVSNTLPGLLKVSGLSLRVDYRDYTENITTVQSKGITSHVKTIPADGADINIVYYRNLVWHAGQLSEVDKPDGAPHFSCFDAYQSFLRATAEKLGANARDVARKFPVQMLVGLSSGYDSIVAAVLARSAGCTQSASIVNPTSFWRGSDSGKHFADRLGMACGLYRHDPRDYRHEIALWAGAGIPGSRNFSLFDYPQPLCLFFSGGYGDVIWDRKGDAVTEPKGGINEFLCEFRLIEGIFVTVVPWWGIRRAVEIQAINQSSEMDFWRLGGAYDRPIARRIIEEAGIPRGTFAQRKKNTSSTLPLRWPATDQAQSSLEQFLRSLGVNVPGRTKTRVYHRLSHWSNLLYKNVAVNLKIKKWWRPWLTYPGRRQLFVWANHTLRDTVY